MKSILDNERSNRIVLAMAIVLSLLIFMDFQARRHYKNQLGFDGDSMEEHARDVSDSLQKPLKATANSILGETRQIINDGIDHTSDVVGSEMDTQGRQVKHKVRDLLKQNLENPGSMNKLRLQAAIVPIPRFINLYYIRFRRGRSELVQVKRQVDDSSFSYYNLLEMLQQGPTLRERGLINTFNKKIQVHAVYKQGTKLVVDLDQTIGKMGKHVIQDRLDQLTWTLTQFPDYNSVVILVDGKAVRQIGQSGVRIPTHLMRSNRKVSAYKQQ